MRIPTVSAGFSKLQDFKIGITYKYDKGERYHQLVVCFGKRDFVIEIS